MNTNINLRKQDLLFSGQNVSLYRDAYYEDDDYYSGRPYPPRDRYDYPPRRSRNDFRPVYSRKDKKNYSSSEPTDSQRFVFNFFKRLTELFLIITGLAFFVTSMCYLLAGALGDSQIKMLSGYYFADITGVSGVFGSIAGIVTGFLFLILFVLQRINRKGWLRKTKLKVHVSWFLSFLIITLISVYFLFVSSSGWWLIIKPKQPLNFTNIEVKNIFESIQNQVKSALNNKFMEGLLNAYYHNALGIVATAGISIGVDLLVVVVGSIYFRGVNDVLDDSYDFFDSRYRRNY